MYGSLNYIRSELGYLANTIQRRSLLDPGTGNGIWCSAAKNVFKIRDTVTSVFDTTGIDIINRNPNGVDTFIQTDFLNYTSTEKFDCILGNPPYAVAEKFIYNSFDLINTESGFMCFLLPLSFLESKRRQKGLWKKHPPTTVSILSTRPSFFPEGHEKYGKSDNTAYSLYIWNLGEYEEGLKPTVTWFNYKDWI